MYVEPCMMIIWPLVEIRVAKKTHGFGISQDGNFFVYLGIEKILHYVHALFNFALIVFM
jgi:hypothetical protein